MDTVNCAGQATATATALAIGGVAPYTYSWNTVPVQNTPTATGLAAGTYTVSVTDANGCGPVTAIATITELLPLSASAAMSGVITCSGDTTSVTITATGGTAPYTYTFNGVTQAGNGFFNGIFAGVAYPWSVTDANGCGPFTGTLDVTEPDPLTVTAAVTTPVPCIGGTATITLTANGGNAPYSYTFNGVTQLGNGVFTSIPVGNGYAWSVDDANGCGPVTGTINVTEPAVLSAIAVISSAIPCIGGTSTVTIIASGGTAPYTYTFNGVTQVGNGVFSGIPAGIAYAWSVNDVNGCGPVSGTISVIAPPVPMASASVTSPVPCAGGTATVTIVGSNGAPPYTYTLNGVTQVGNGVFTGIPAGTGYSWTVFDNNGCGPVTGTISVTQPNPLLALAIVLAPIPCVGGTAIVLILTAGGTAPFTYTFNGVTQVGNGFFFGIPSGNAYAWSVTDANACGPVSGTLNVIEPVAPTATASVTSPIVCAGGTATVTITGAGGALPYTYTFNGVTQVGNGVFTGIPAGSAYSWTMFDAYGCGPVTGTINVTEPAALTASAAVSTPIPCIGGTATVTLTATGGTPPYSYTFNGVTQVGNGVFTGIPAGIAYAWSVNDSNGCGPVNGTLDVVNPPLLTASATVTTPVPCTGGTATVTLTASNGTAPYTYTFNGVTQVGNGVFTGIPAGTAYAWSVTDSNGCAPVTGTITVTQPNPVLALAIVLAPIPCVGGTAIVLILTAGGTAPFTYTFNGVTQVGSGFFFGIPSGSGYAWSVTDANGCGPVSGTLNVLEPTPPTATASVTSPILCAGGTATVSIVGAGGALPYTFTLNGVTQVGNGTFTGVAAGTAYSWTMFDAYGCGPVSGTIDVTEPAVLAASASVTTPALCSGGTSTVTIVATGGIPPYIIYFQRCNTGRGWRFHRYSSRYRICLECDRC